MLSRLKIVLLLHSANVCVNEVRLLSLLGDVEIGSWEKFLKISKTPSLTAAKATESICLPRHKVRSLQRFQRMRIEEKGHNAHECDAMIVKPRLLVGVSSDYDFAEVVFDVAKGKCFLFPFRL